MLTFCTVAKSEDKLPLLQKFYDIKLQRLRKVIWALRKRNFVETKDGHKSAMIGKQTQPHRTVAIALSAIEQINNYSFFFLFLKRFKDFFEKHEDRTMTEF